MQTSAFNLSGAAEPQKELQEFEFLASATREVPRVDYAPMTLL